MRGVPALVPVIALTGMAIAPRALYLQAVLAGRIRDLRGPGSAAVLSTLLAWALAGGITALAAAPRPALAGAGYACAGIMLAGLYLLPVLIGRARRVPRPGMLGVTLGWTGTGWLPALRAALGRAGRAAARQDGAPVPG